MVKIIKFPTKDVQYSDKFIKNVDPTAIGNFIKAETPTLSMRAADAMALAIIYSTYLQLVFDEEGSNVPKDILQKFEDNDEKTFCWHTHDKKTLH
jgi:hypothetical protein|tara:strand:+ start:366 stop:650 length:285 start_codon:yes stop_codon:yes gene_type:complete